MDCGKEEISDGVLVALLAQAVIDAKIVMAIKTSFHMATFPLGQG